jgi:hypothetical protein
LWNLDDGFAGVVLLKKGETPPTLLPRCIRHIYTHGLDKSTVETKS